MLKQSPWSILWTFELLTIHVYVLCIAVRTAEDEMVRSHHCLSGRESEQTWGR